MTTENLTSEFPNFEQLVAQEKLAYMQNYAKSSTFATILAPLLCIPLYLETTSNQLFNAWFIAMALVVLVRIFLIRALDLSGELKKNFLILNFALGIVTFVWGIGWFIFVPTSDPVNYLIYQIICLTILFVGMVGYCVSWKSFFSFVLPLKTPELIFIVLHHDFIIWPIAIGSMVAFYLALKMVFLFSKSWEKSFSLRLKNDALIDQLVTEKNASIAANLAKSEFIATASHDLRQPMQSINIFVDMIELKNLQDYEKSIFSRMRSSIAVLNKMFNTLLDISKLDSNFSTSESTFSLVQLIQELTNTYAHLCHEKGLSLEFEYTDCWIKGDPQLTSQILRNLLSNAVQYTETGGIVVSFRSDTNLLQFCVKDTGCGIPREDMPVIFKEFYRSEHSRSQHDGLGLGLSIVNRIVKKIGGECAVSSTVDKGSTFEIRTPFSVFDKTSPNDIRHIHATIPRTAGKPLSSQTSDGVSSNQELHLGIIENDPSLQTAYAQYFSKAGMTVHIIPHTESAFLDCLAEIPKLNFILSDFRLGEKNGIYFIQKLREEFNDDIPACIVTADTSPKHIKLFDQLNIHVLYKPIDIKLIEEFMAQNLAA